MRGRPFPPGQSGNPGGRSRGATAMARMIREETRDGAELVEFALAILRGKNLDGTPNPMATPSSRMYAHQWLSDRGFGKRTQDVDLLVGATELTPEQATMLGALRMSPHERRER